MGSEESRIALAKRGMGHSKLARQFGVSPSKAGLWGQCPKKFPRMAKTLVTKMLAKRESEGAKCSQT